MKIVIMDGPRALAASIVGATAPTVKPIAEAAKASTILTPENFKNLIHNHHPTKVGH